MSQADQDQKTHDPTEKKLSDAREKGDIASAPEMRHAVMLVATVIVAGWMGSAALHSLSAMFVRLWGGADSFRLDPGGVQAFAGGVLGEVALSLAPVMLMLMGCALLTMFVQGRPTLSWSRVAPQWSKLDPAAGLKRLFGVRALVEFSKTLLKFTAVIVVALTVVWPKAAGLDQLIGSGPEAMVKAVAVLVAAIALFDFLYQRHAFLKKMRMTLQEVKDEMKQNDGNPEVKARIRSIGIQRSRKRMMAAVPTASVIVTNPTHYAVALKYDHGAMAAPVVVAKGVDAVAMKIREVAAAAGVPIVESPPLARALFAAAEIDRPIPAEHYAAVAEIIGYVMRLARHLR